jgi:hypothetical protein
LIMDLLEAEVRNDCPGEGQQQFNWNSVATMNGWKKSATW